MSHQRCKHIAAIRRALREEGATAVEVERDGQRLRVSWHLGERRCAMVTQLHHRDEVAARNFGRQAMRRACRETLLAEARPS